jgi:hypothetical protein
MKFDSLIFLQSVYFGELDTAAIPNAKAKRGLKYGEISIEKE